MIGVRSSDSFATPVSITIKECRNDERTSLTDSGNHHTYVPRSHIY